MVGVGVGVVLGVGVGVNVAVGIGVAVGVAVGLHAGNDSNAVLREFLRTLWQGGMARFPGI